MPTAGTQRKMLGLRVGSAGWSCSLSRIAASLLNPRRNPCDTRQHFLVEVGMFKTRGVLDRKSCGLLRFGARVAELRARFGYRAVAGHSLKGALRGCLVKRNVVVQDVRAFATTKQGESQRMASGESEVAKALVESTCALQICT